MRISVSVRFSSVHRCYLSLVCINGVMHQQARGDSKASAVASAVAGFRATRFLRRAMSPGGSGAMLFGRWCKAV